MNCSQKIKRIWKSFTHTIESCILCIRFPFLYPRNRWTNKHYTNWKIHSYLYGNNLHGDNPNAFINKVFKYETQNVNGKLKIKKRILNIFYYIWFYIVKFIAEGILPIFHCIPTYTELDAMPTGWREAFGIQLCKDLRRQLIKDRFLFSYRIAQIKEKWGSLRWYSACASKDVYNILNKYEDLSYNICINCGKPATKISSGWISPYCDDCFPKEYKVYGYRENNKWKYTNCEEDLFGG